MLTSFFKHIFPRLPYDLFYRIWGYPIGSANRADYRYLRSAIPSPIPHFTPTTSDVIRGMGVAQFLSLYHPLYTTTLDVILSDIPIGRGIPRTGCPPGEAPPIERRYPVRPYRSPAFHFYNGMSSFLQALDLS